MLDKQCTTFALRMIGVLAAVSPAAVWADEAEGGRPTTKLEAFSARTGVVVVRGFTEVGMIGTSRGSVEFDAREFRDARDPKQVQYGVLVTVKESGRLEREHRSFVDEDELDSIIQGIDYITKIDKSVTTFENFEASLQTKGELAVTVFSTSSRQLGFAISSGRIGKATAFVSSEDIAQMRGLLVRAKELFAASKSPKK